MGLLARDSTSHAGADIWMTGIILEPGRDHWVRVPGPGHGIGIVTVLAALGAETPEIRCPSWRAKMYALRTTQIKLMANNDTPPIHAPCLPAD